MPKSNNKAEHMQRVEEFAETVKQAIIEEAQHLLGSGAVNYDEWDAEDFSLAKILVNASIARVLPNFRPLNDEYRRMVKNIESI